MPNPLPDNRCQYTRANGKRCRMPRMNGHASLCPHHARQRSLSPPTLDLQLRFQESGGLHRSPDTGPPTSNPQIALDLLGPIQDFRTAASINHVLGNLVILLATDRIPPRNAAVLAYVCQLLLQSLSDVKHELWLAKDEPDLKKTLKQILNAPSPGTAASKFVDDVCKLTLSDGRTEGPALVKSNGSATT